MIGMLAADDEKREVSHGENECSRGENECCVEVIVVVDDVGISPIMVNI